MAPSLSKHLQNNKLYIVSGTAIAAATLGYILKRSYGQQNKSNRKPIRRKAEEEIKYMISEKKEPKIKAHVNVAFFRNLSQLIKIVIPKWNSSEAGLLLLICISLVFRSMCDLWLIHHNTKIESAIIGMNKKLFQQRLLRFLIALPVISTINNILRYSIGELKIHLRKNMTHRLFEEYLKKFTYYRVTNLDNRITNIDQLLTADVDKFCQSATDLFCNIAKPLLDMGIYVYKLSSNLGYHTPGLLLCYLAVAGFTLTNLRRPVGSMTVTEQKLEGEFRHVNNRIITYSEEIAFYQGNAREQKTLLASFNKLVAHIRNFLHFRVIMGIADDIIAKYFAFFIGFCAVSVPFLANTHSLSKENPSERSRLYYTYGSMLLRLGEAVGRLVLAGRELTKLAGFTVRVTQLRQVLEELDKGTYQRTMVAGTENLTTNRGRLIFKDNIIKFNKVPLITPNGDVLIKELSIEIQSGMNVLVCGPNGAGKSSLFRILGELWPLFGGELTKPPRGKLFYIPQKPYMTLGSLRDQITYPHSSAEAVRRGCTDEKLKRHLKQVELDYLLEREGGFNAVEDWLDVLSGGEKQRIAMARLFHHAPQFAILDECTSAVAIDVECSMYKYCREIGITLITVSHRKSLWEHHEFVLYLDGRGNYSFERIEDGMEQFGS